MTAEFLLDYLPIILFLIIALGLSCAFIVINFILSPKNPDPEKLSAYECGFEPFQDLTNGIRCKILLSCNTFYNFRS